MRKALIPGASVLACSLAGAAGGTEGQEVSGGVVFSGHYKNMAVVSTTAVDPPERYTLDMNRLRLEWKGQLRPHLGIEVQYDNEVLAGNYVRTREFQLLARQPLLTYWDLQSDHARRGEVVARHRLRRGAVTLSEGATDIRLGRQRVAWGTGRFWSPMDLLNPVSPTALEPGEREGVDAILVEHKRSAVSRVSFIYAPVRGGGDNVLGQWHGNAAEIDYSVTAGRVREGTVLGVDLAGQWRGAGLRAEWSLTRQSAGGMPLRMLLGWDYAFANTLTLSAELYYDGSGASDPAHYDIAALLAGRRQSLGKRYAGLYGRYEITPLLKWENWLARNLDDRSWYFSPRLTYSLRENIDLAIGAQLHGGGPSSEFGRRKNLWFAYAQWFF